MEEIDLSLNPVEPNSRDFTKDVVKDISPTKEPQVLTVLTTHPTLPLNMKFQPSSESLFAYVMWIFLPFLVYSVVPHYLLSLRNEDIIFDPGICMSTFSKPVISHRCGTVKKFNTHRSHLNEYPMMLNGKNIHLLDVPHFHFYPLDSLKYGGIWSSSFDLKQALRGRNVNLLISKIKALNANPTTSFDCKTKFSSTSLTSLLEETNTFDNSLPEFKTFCFDVEEISSGIVPCYLLSLRNEDIIFDPGICKSTFSKTDISHQCETVKKFNTHRSHLNKCPMMIHGQNNPLLDVLLFHFYPP
nr:hypothetical protein [Tanacetum cinerariifolium]